MTTLETFDNLILALTANKRHWTPEQRKLYERCTRALTHEGVKD